jgi:hypothetical protein
MKRSRMKQRNPERLARLRARQFGPQAEMCRALRCCVCRDPGTVPEHARPRGMGGMNGKDSDTVPLCNTCHQLRHDHGQAGPFLYGRATAGVDVFAYHDGVLLPHRSTAHGLMVECAHRYFAHVARGLEAVLKLTRVRS